MAPSDGARSNVVLIQGHAGRLPIGIGMLREHKYDSAGFGHLDVSHL